MLRKESVPFRSVLFQTRPLLFRLWRLIFLLFNVIFLNLVVFLIGEFNNFGPLRLSDLRFRRFNFGRFFGFALRLFLGLLRYLLPWSIRPHQRFRSSIPIWYVTVLAFSRVEVAVSASTTTWQIRVLDRGALNAAAAHACPLSGISC